MLRKEGEISFCAYNTGRGLAEHHREDAYTATLTKWYEEHGRMKSLRWVGKRVNLEDKDHALYLRESIVYETKCSTISISWGSPRRRAKRKSGARDSSRLRPAGIRRTMRLTMLVWRRCIVRLC